MASPFTCRNCSIQIWDLEILKQHYKSEWHKYNLKKKIINQPPITFEEFEMLNVMKSKKFEQSNDNRYCNTCRKKFNTQNQYENHLVSKKHKENSDKQENNENELSQKTESTVKNINSDTSRLDNSVSMENTISSKKTDVEDVETDSIVESVDSDDWIEDTENPVNNNNCLFCDHHSRSLTRNLKHMIVAHTFFIPDPEYCVDLRGLLTYLGEKIFAGYMCIWCNNSGKAFQSADAVRAHMLDKGHCKMLHEGEALLEYSDFYDYSSSYPDAKNEDPDEEVGLPTELDDTDYQMKLPSGNVIGHRALMRYYKQKLNPNRTVDLSVSHKMRKVMLQYRSLGWTNTKQQEEATRKARDIKYMQRIQAKYATQLQFKANKLQRYFRKQTMF